MCLKWANSQRLAIAQLFKIIAEESLRRGNSKLAWELADEELNSSFILLLERKYHVEKKRGTATQRAVITLSLDKDSNFKNLTEKDTPERKGKVDNTDFNYTIASYISYSFIKSLEYACGITHQRFFSSELLLHERFEEPIGYMINKRGNFIFGEKRGRVFTIEESNEEYKDNGSLRTVNFFLGDKNKKGTQVLSCSERRERRGESGEVSCSCGGKNFVSATSAEFYKCTEEKVLGPFLDMYCPQK